MKMKKKIMAIWVVLLLIAISCSIAEAGETNTEQESYLVEIATIREDGNEISETLELSESEITEFESAVAEAFEKIQSANGLDEVKEIFQRLLGHRSSLIGTIAKVFLRSKTSRSRALVLSHGKSYDYNILRRSKVKIRNKIQFWHYGSSRSIGKARTFILKPLALDFDVLSGSQVGLMTKFTGLYIHISKRLPKQSYTFFIGTARHIRGMDFNPSIKNKNSINSYTPSYGISSNPFLYNSLINQYSY